MKEKNKAGGMERVAAFIVDKRYLFFLLYTFALIFSVFAMNWVKVENDITTYLPDDTETKQGLVVMDENFVTNGSARVMVSNVAYDTAENFSAEIAEIPGVSSVTFDDTPSHYKNASALYEVSFSDPASDPTAISAMEQIRGLLSGYDLYVDSEVGLDQVAMLQSEMGVILIIAVVIILVVLTLTSRSYAEVPVLLLTFAAAALLNKGTDFVIGTISFISNSVTVVLQLALAVDYAIILCHAFSDEHESLPPREACIAALSRSIPAIFASSLTTISGLAAMGFMKFGIGMDMAVCLIKAIFYSLFTVFTLMPGLLMLFSPLIDKTRHKNLIRSISLIGRADVKTRFVIPPLFVAVLIFAALYASKCPYCYSYTDLVTARQNEQQISYQKIKSTFGTSNMLAIVVPAGDYGAERAILDELSSREEVSSAMGLSNIEALDGYALTDALTPREFSELLNTDYEVMEMLYTLYAIEEVQYGELLGGMENFRVPLYDMFLFLKEYLESRNITLDGEEGEKLEELFTQLESAEAQLHTDQYSRLAVYLNLPEESPETFAFLDTIHQIADPYYEGQVFVLGSSTSSKDLSASFVKDNTMISILSALFVILILLFTFKSAILPVLLILVIQGSIWLNFSVNTITGTPLYFLGYLTVNAIQMGANIDYAIVISSHYAEKKKLMNPRHAIVAALNSAFPTVFTSGTILASAAFLVGRISTQPVIAILGECLARGTLISIVLVLCVLPQFLLLGNRLIDATSFEVRALEHAPRSANGTMFVKGRVRGQISGIVDAEINGVLHGQVNAVFSSGATVDVTEPKKEEPEEKQEEKIKK